MALWKTSAGSGASQGVGGWLGWPAPRAFSSRAWEELGFSTGEVAAPRGMVGARQAVPIRLLPAWARALPRAHLLETSLRGLLTSWRWDDLVVSGATALLG